MNPALRVFLLKSSDGHRPTLQFICQATAAISNRSCPLDAPCGTSYQLHRNRKQPTSTRRHSRIINPATAKNTMELPACRFDDPKAVVATFIRAMNAWELFAAGLSKEDGVTSWTIVKQQVDAVFACFCTPKDRPYGRLGSFQSPPEYDPAHEEIIGFTMESPKKAFVDTRREAVLGGGEYRYVLHLSDGKWLIDNLKLKEPDGSYSKAIL